MLPLVSLTCVSLAWPHAHQAALKENWKASSSQLSQQVMAPSKCFWIQMSSVTKAWKIPPWYIVSVCASGWFLLSVYYFCFRSSCFPEFDRYNTGIMISSVNSALHRSMQYCFVQVGFFVIYDGNFFFGRGRMAILMACSNSLLGSLFGFFFFNHKWRQGFWYYTVLLLQTKFLLICSFVSGAAQCQWDD